ncbi:hypothetical protein K1719_037372 [Acacia pycnantha]|nr:hypothetical protein K1719_037372 [Acacia pycnantha]
MPRGLWERPLGNIKLLCHGPKPSIIVISETKTSDLNRFYLLASMVVVWDSSRISVSVLEENFQFFHLRCQSSSVPLLFLTAIYAVPNANNRELLWSNIWRLSKGITDPWSVVGDFNDISSIDERVGGRSGNNRRATTICLKPILGILHYGGLFVVKEYIDQGSLWRSANGLTVNFFDDSWILWRLNGLVSDNIIRRLYASPSPTLKRVKTLDMGLLRLRCVSGFYSFQHRLEDQRRGASWYPPPDGWLKMNLDGAVTSRGAAGCGGVLRDSRGLWVFGFSFYLGVCSPLERKSGLF